MSAPTEAPPPNKVVRAAQAGYASGRDLVATLMVVIGLPAPALRAGDDAAASPSRAVLRLTFGAARAEELSYRPKRDALELAPKPFEEVFGEIPDDAARQSFAVSLLGPAGVILTLATLIAAAICIDLQWRQSQAPLQAITRPADPTKSDVGKALSDSFLPSNRRPGDVLNQVAPNSEPETSRSSTPDQPQQQQAPPRNLPSQPSPQEQRGPKTP